MLSLIIVFGALGFAGLVALVAVCTLKPSQMIFNLIR